MTFEYDNRVIYSDDKYVPRRVVEEELISMINNSANPVISVIGPPGTGKTWLLYNIVKTINEGQSQAAILYSASDLITAFKNNLASVKKNLVRAANQCCMNLNIPEENLFLDLDTLINNIIDHSMHKCLNSNLFIVITECDSVSNAEDFEDLQKKINMYFLQPNNAFFKILLEGRRILSGSLKSKVKIIELGVFNTEEAEKHKEKWLAINQQDLEDPSDLYSGSNYQWNHPFINSFLWERSKQHILTADDLRECFLELVTRPSINLGTTTRFPPLELDQLEKYINWATLLNESWTANEFRYVADGKQLQEEHLQRGIIRDIREQGHSMSKYTFAPGLRELLRDIATWDALEYGS